MLQRHGRRDAAGKARPGFRPHHIRAATSMEDAIIPMYTLQEKSIRHMRKLQRGSRKSAAEITGSFDRTIRCIVTF